MENRTYGGDASSRGRRPAYNPDGQPRQGGHRPRFNRPQSPDGATDEHRPRPRFNAYRQELNANRQQDGERRQHFRSENNGGQRPYNREGNQRKRFSSNNSYSQRRSQDFPRRYEDPNKEIRLNKFLANAGICSRREADDFIQAGVITVNGEVVASLGAKVKPTDEVKFHDQPVRRERKVYILLNKPKNCVTTTDDPQERKTVIDIVKNACSERIYPVGRLDRNTTGVLLLTNDGDLAAKLTHPKFGKKKVYAATLDRDLTEEDFAELQAGVTLDGELIVPDAIAFTKEEDRRHIGLEIHSGQNRVVRRMFEKIGYKVMQLDRVSFAGLTKKNVARGKYRFLTPKEVSMLQMGAFE